MKNKLYLLGLFVLVFSACNEEVDPYTGDAKEGGLVTIQTGLVNYVIGNNADYTVGVLVNQSGNTASTSSVEVYSHFETVEKDGNGDVVYRDEDGQVSEEDLGTTTSVSSNEVLLGTIAPSSTAATEPATLTVNFDDLVEGITVNGAGLTGDADLLIGDAWVLRFVSKLDDGRSVEQAKSAKISVATRFAGEYKVVEGTYYRIGVNRSDVSWPGTMTIASVDAITYQQLEYFGAFDGNTLYFQIDPATNDITYPEEWKGVAQSGNGQPLTTCNRNGGDLQNVPCGEGTNTVILDDVEGKDRLIMTYGYLTDGSGPREFYQILEKIN